MKKHYIVLFLLLAVLSVGTQAQIVSSRMNEVFSKTILSNTGLSNPWEITYGPDDSLWVTDAKAYTVYKVSPITGIKRLILDISNTSTFLPASFRRTFTSTQNPWPQGGLAGLAIHPDFMNTSSPKKYIFISYVRKYDSASATTNGGYFFKNSVVRFTYNTSSGQLENPVALCDTLPGSSDHNSQRMIIAPVNGVNYLFYGSGDMGAGQLSSAKRVNRAQDTTCYQGKILRFNIDPDPDTDSTDMWIPNDNPFNASRQSAIWATGMRNNQGFAYDSVRNILYGSSHGPYSDDEVNIIERNKNYGHPLVIGYAADNNYNGSSAGAYPASASTLAAIVNETSAAAAIPNYKDPLLTGYPTTQSTINTIWTTAPGNNTWPSEAWSGLGLYNYSAIPGWKNSLLMAGLKWGRIIRTKLDNSGAASLPSGTMADTVIYFDGLPRYRDMAFGPNGKDIYMVMESGNSGASPAGTGVNNPLLVACASCIEKFTFLGYNQVAGTSSIPGSIAIAAGKPNLCEDANTININASNDTLWVPITDTSGNVVAEINAKGNLLGNVATSLFTTGGPAREQDANKTLYIGRNITITPQTQPSSAISVRIYLSKTEFDALKGAVNSQGQPSNVNNVTDLSIFKNSDYCSPAISSTAPAMATTNQAAFGTDGYVLQTSITSFSTFYVASATSLLPVHSLIFKGSITNNIGQLRWTTEDEKNTQSFTVERSINGRDFSPLGNVIASSANGQAVYAYPDSAVAQLPSTIIYYRLKLTGVAGAISYSNIIILKTFTSTSLIAVRPNPVINDFVVDVTAVVTENDAWQITDVTGKTVMQRQVTLNKGDNQININIGHLPAGVYYLKVAGASINQSVKLQKR